MVSLIRVILYKTRVILFGTAHLTWHQVHAAGHLLKFKRLVSKIILLLPHN